MTKEQYKTKIGMVTKIENEGVKLKMTRGTQYRLELWLRHNVGIDTDTQQIESDITRLDKRIIKLECNRVDLVNALGDHIKRTKNDVWVSYNPDGSIETP